MENAQFRIGGLTERDLRRWKRLTRAARFPKPAVVLVIAVACFYALSPRTAGKVTGPDIKVTNEAGRVVGQINSGSVNCDCPHVDAGFLTGPYRDQCFQSEKELQALVAAGKFQVTVGPNHTL